MKIIKKRRKSIFKTRRYQVTSLLVKFNSEFHNLNVCILLWFLKAYSTYVYAGALAAEIICAIISTLLILGAVKGRRNFLLPWLIYILIVMVATVVAFIMSVIMLDTMVGVSILVVGILQLCKFNLIIIL